LIDHEMFQAAVDQAVRKEEPLAVFAKDTELAMVTTVCSELACQLRNIVKQFAALVRGKDTNASGKPQQKINVVITGGDGKLFKSLLQPDASHIVSVEPDVVFPDNLDIHFHKTYSHYGIGLLLHEKCLQKPKVDQEDLHVKILGLRVATASQEEDGLVRGTVLSVNESASIDDYKFVIRLDHKGQQELWPVKKFYDGLVLYNNVGEKSVVGKEQTTEEEWVLKKKETSKSVQDELANKSSKIMERRNELLPHIVSGELKKFLGFRKRRTGMPSKARNKTRRIENPEQFVGRRVAKEFPIQDPEDSSKVKFEVFFGTVKTISDEGKLWYLITYDDGDKEEVELHELWQLLQFYSDNKALDSMVGQEGVIEEEKSAQIDSAVPSPSQSAKPSKMDVDSSSSRRIGEYKEDVP